jgi:hypothetical protein
LPLSASQKGKNLIFIERLSSQQHRYVAAIFHTKVHKETTLVLLARCEILSNIPIQILPSLLYPMKQISAVEEKPFTSSIYICPKARCRKGLGRGQKIALKKLLRERSKKTEFLI